jgi:hypothetical protein
VQAVPQTTDRTPANRWHDDGGTVQQENATEQIMEVRSLLLQQCHLFDDPASYEAGIEDATAAFHHALTGRPAEPFPGELTTGPAGWRDASG